MTQSPGTPELSRSDLAALDLLIAHLEETGRTSLGGPEAFISVITNAARAVVAQVAQAAAVNAVQQVTANVVDATAQAARAIAANTPEVTEITEVAVAVAGAGADLRTSDNPVLRSVLEGDVTLDQLVAVRRALGQG